MNINHSEILAARNRVRLAHKVYMHEATMTMLKAESQLTISQSVDILALWYLWKRGKKLDYLKENDWLKIFNLDRVISYKK